MEPQTTALMCRRSIISSLMSYGASIRTSSTNCIDHRRHRKHEASLRRSNNIYIYEQHAAHLAPQDGENSLVQSHDRQVMPAVLVYDGVSMHSNNDVVAKAIGINNKD
jgi:hypothetical protein